MDNLERALIAEVIAAGNERAVRTNPVLEDLGARIVEAEPGKVNLHFHLGTSDTPG